MSLALRVSSCPSWIPSVVLLPQGTVEDLGQTEARQGHLLFAECPLPLDIQVVRSAVALDAVVDIAVGQTGAIGDPGSDVQVLEVCLGGLENGIVYPAA